jgi:hypothetical protein
MKSIKYYELLVLLSIWGASGDTIHSSKMDRDSRKSPDSI